LTARESADVYANNVTGSIAAPAPGIVNPLQLALDVVGDTSGSLQASIQYNNTRAIVAGEWTFTATGDAGTLSGTISDGVVRVNDDGSIAGVSQATLVIQTGGGAHHAVTQGNGTLDGTFDRSLTPVFSGTLSFSF
jgi:hypothetical protein